MKKLLATIGIACLASLANAQDFMLQGWYWDYPKTCNGFNWADTLKSKSSILQNNFTYVWLPPFSRASFGSCSNGYDPKDLYDLGEYGGGATGFGTRTNVDALVAEYNTKNIKTVADVVYNHRDGGKPEVNTAVEGWIENMTCTKVSSGDQPFPADRYRCFLPLGGSSNNGAGDYYFKMRSASKHKNYIDRVYKIYMVTNTVGYQGLSTLYETEGGSGNGGADCGQPTDPTPLQLGRSLAAKLDNTGDCGGGCGCSSGCCSACAIDEFKLTLNASDYNAGGDTLWIYLDTGGVYSDVYIHGLWSTSRNMNIQGEINYQTYTNFNGLPSGQGGMNYLNFKPNGNPTQLSGDWDWLWFFYDYDQNVASTKTTLYNWSKWLWNSVSIRGYRMDAVKHFPEAFVGDLMDDFFTNSITPGMVVGEFFDSNPTLLKNWVTNVLANMDAATKTAINVRVFDFSLRQALKNACDQFGYDARNVFNAGIVDGAAGSGFNSVTFVNNHDFRDPGQPVWNDPMLAYAYILTNNQVGVPCVFYPEYFGKAVTNYPPNVNLKTHINELIQIHKSYIYQSNKRDYLNRIGTGYAASYASGFPSTTLLFQLNGGVANKDVLICINFAGSALDVTHQINADLDGNGTLNFGPGQTFAEATSKSNSPTLTVSGSYQVNIKLPARSYAVWVQGALLPVELVNFDATAKDDHVELSWRAASEKNFDGYQLERSVDGKNFDPIAWLPGNGSLTEPAAYTFLDHTAPRSETLYYRLRMKDLDGSENFSSVRSARLNDAWEKPLLFPNPTNSNAVLTFRSPKAGAGNLALFDTMGTLVLRQEIALEEGVNALELESRSLPAGVYFAVLTSEGKVRWRERVVRR
jgi:alpha-amylase